MNDLNEIHKLLGLIYHEKLKAISELIKDKDSKEGNKRYSSKWWSNRYKEWESSENLKCLGWI